MLLILTTKMDGIKKHLFAKENLVLESMHLITMNKEKFSITKH
jgi:hypothetical protein